LFGPAVRQQFTYRGGFVPSWLWACFGDTCIVAIDGVTTLLQGLGLYASTQQLMSQIPSGGVNSTVLVAATSIFNQLVSQLGGGPRNWVLCGYSYGGALAETVGAMLLAGLQPASVQIATFGSPRPGDANLAAALEQASLVRWMCDSDPIPRFPPTFLEAPNMTVQAGFTAAVNWSLYVQPKGGMQLDSLGTITVQQLPGRTLPIVALQLAAWLSGADAFGSAGHALNTYLTRLNAAIAGAGPVPNVNAPPAVAETPTPLTQQAFNADAAIVAAGVQVIALGRSPMALYVPIQYRPKVVFFAGVYKVMWMGYTMADCPTKSAAKTYAKYIFRMARTLVDATTTYSGSTQNGWRDFLTAASNPTGGFLPVLTVI
jgi:pimeloyl-ACP methyl ester carboxylesterase